MSNVHVPLSDLPNSIRRVLASIGYRSRDIDVYVQDHVSLYVSGGAGQRGFATVVNLVTGESQTMQGSWGGANMFSAPRVDTDDREVALGPNVAVVKGSTGHRTFASVYIGTMNVVKALAPAPTLPLKARQILYCYKSIKSGQYRTDELRSIRATEAEIAQLIEAGYLKRDGRGTQITTAGKNAIGSPNMMPRE